MARYYFHLRDCSDQLLDPEGVDLPNLETAKAQALLAARDTLSNEMKAGTLDLRYRIEVEDAAASVAYSLPLRDSFKLVAGDSW